MTCELCTAAGAWVCRGGESATTHRCGPCSCPCHREERNDSMMNPCSLSPAPGNDDLEHLASRYRHHAGKLFSEGDDEGATKYRDMVKRIEGLMMKVSELPLPVTMR